MNIWDPIWSEETKEIDKFQPFLLTFNGFISRLPNMGNIDLHSLKITIKIRFSELFIDKNFSKSELYIMDDGRCNISLRPDWTTHNSATAANSTKKKSVWNIIVKDNGFDLVPELPTTYFTPPGSGTGSFQPTDRRLAADFGSLVLWLRNGVSFSPNDIKCAVVIELMKSPLYQDTSGNIWQKPNQAEPRRVVELTGSKLLHDITDDWKPTIELLNQIQFSTEVIHLYYINLKSSSALRSMIKEFSVVPITTKERVLRAGRSTSLVLKGKRPTSSGTASKSPIDNLTDQTQRDKRMPWHRRIVIKLYKLFKKGKEQ